MFEESGSAKKLERSNFFTMQTGLSASILAVDFLTDIDPKAAPPYVPFVEGWHFFAFLQLFLEVIPLVVVFHGERGVLKTPLLYEVLMFG